MACSTDDDHGQIAGRVVGAQALQRVQAAHARKLQVEDRDIHWFVRITERLERFFSGLGLQYSIALTGEHHLQGAPDVLLVVDDENGGGTVLSG